MGRGVIGSFRVEGKVVRWLVWDHNLGVASEVSIWFAEVRMRSVS